MASTWWWVVVPPAEQNANSVPADARIISTPEGSTAYNTLLNTDSGTVNISGQPYVRYMGPFASQADAEKAKPGDLTIVPGYTVAPSGQVKGPLSGLAAVTDFLGRLEKPSTWLRVAEAIAGLMLLALGLNALLNNPAGKALQTVAAVKP